MYRTDYLGDIVSFGKTTSFSPILIFYTTSIDVETQHNRSEVKFLLTYFSRQRRYKKIAIALAPTLGPARPI